MTAWFLGGSPVDGLPLGDRAWQFGDGVFETIAIRDGAPRFLDWHIERALTGCTRLGIDSPAPERFTADISSALKATSVDTQFAVLKLVITAGQSPRGYGRRAGAEPRLYVGVFSSLPLADACYLDGVRVRICNTRLARQPQLAGIKSLNRLEQVLARNEWQDTSIFEGLTFDTDGSLICGTMSNVFLVEDMALVTPDLSHAGVAGIMRRSVMEAANTAGIDCVVRPVGEDELLDGRELFLTNSQFGVLPVRELSGQHLSIGTTTRKLMRCVRDTGVSEIAC